MTRRVNRTAIANLLILLLIGPAWVSAAPNAETAQLYGQYCSVCHGEKGDGNSHAVQGMQPPPRDFTQPGVEFKLPREYMIEVVTNGKPGTAMTGWKSRLDEEQIASLVDFIRTRFMDVAEAGQGRSGQAIYASTCSVCHGEDGMGALWGNVSLNPPPVNFSTTDPVSDLPRERMIASVTYGRPGTAMAAFSTQLSDTEIEAVVDYIRDAFMSRKGHTAPEQASTGASMAVLHNAYQSDTGTSAGGTHVDFSLPVPGGIQGDEDTGRAYYLQNCTACHGVDGKGDGPRAYFIFPKPRNFQLPANRARFNRPALFHAIKDGVRGREMPAWGKVLDDQRIADITEYVFQTFIRPGAAVSEQTQ